MGLSHTKAGGTSPENMNLLVNEPTRRPGQPLCQDPWGWGRFLVHRRGPCAGCCRRRPRTGPGPERIWNPAMPLLFQRQVGMDNRAIPSCTIRDWICESMPDTSPADTGQADRPLATRQQRRLDRIRRHLQPPPTIHRPAHQTRSHGSPLRGIRTVAISDSASSGLSRGSHQRPSRVHRPTTSPTTQR